MAKKREKIKQKRQARPARVNSINNINADEEFYLKFLNSNNTKFLYDFIYGKKRHELNVLMRGYGKLFEQTKDPKEKIAVVSLAEATFGAYKDAIKDKFARFKQREGEFLPDVVRKAKEGSDSNLFILVAFDKAYLFEPFVQERILKAEAEEDHSFLQNLGEALKRKKGIIDVIPGNRDERQRRLRKLIRCLRLAHFDFSKKENIKLVEGMLVKIGDGTYTDFPEPILTNQLKRTLKRMGLIESK